MVACNRNAVPVITSHTTEPELPAKPVNDMEPDIKTGKIFFTNRSGKCHGLPKPDEYTAKRWEEILSYMIPRARLSNEQGVHVRAYLEGNAAK